MMTITKTTPYDALLPQVEKPSRYLGTEYNTSHKEASAVDLRVCLAFPDLYDLGLGNLGLLILYAILNQREWCWAERAYVPGLDMEALLRENDLKLFANESKDSLDQFDLVGFTLQSELTFTNILTMLDLGGIPLRSVNRTDAHPLVCGGGPAVFNPEPLAPFFDFFVIGDGEDVIVEIAETMRAHKNASRETTLRALSEIGGLYVPSLYPMDTLEDGRILPAVDGPIITKRVVRDFDAATFPVNYIVPYTQQVHDRIGLEVLRGCTQGCRFCQAGMTTRPVRERSLENIDALMEQSLANTGYEEVGLVSLSTCDYSKVRTLVSNAAKRARPNHVAVSLPSLRLDSFAVELADKVAGVRRSGLTFAPEAATPRLRAVINKWIPDEELLDMSGRAYSLGWDHVKTYFMIGLPTERDEDVEAIADLCIRTQEAGRKINPRAKVNTGVSTFVPKPFTPFQWAEQIGLEETERRQDLLKRAFYKKNGIKFGRHDPATTWIEGLITRADRRGADLIEAAWRHGARLETWDEHVNMEHWKKAIEETGFNVEAEFRERDIHERLPWDHIDVMIPKEWFQKDWANALELRHAQDCRAGKCHLCGVIYKERELCKTMLKRQKQGNAWEEEHYVDEPMQQDVEEAPVVQRLRIRIGRQGEVRFLSHLETMNAWIRALRRARMPIAYSQGFHAHPRINFATAAPVGEASDGDYMDVLLNDYITDIDGALAQLCAVLPEGFQVYDIEEIHLKAPSLMSAVTGFAYSLTACADSVEVAARAAELLASEEILVERKAKTKKRNRFNPKRARKTVDLRPMLVDLEVEDADGKTTANFTTQAVNGSLIKPREMMALLELDPATTHILKRDTHLEPIAAELALG